MLSKGSPEGVYPISIQLEVSPSIVQFLQRSANEENSRSQSKMSLSDIRARIESGEGRRTGGDDTDSRIASSETKLQRDQNNDPIKRKEHFQY